MRIKKKWFIDKKTTVGFGLALSILIGIGAFSYLNFFNYRKTNDRVTHTHEVLQTNENILVLIINAETGQRGYLIAGEERYLEPYYIAIKTIEQEIKELRQLISDNPNQQRRLDILEQLVVTKFAELRETIALRRNKGLEAALQVVKTSQGKDLMDQIRQLNSEIATQENQLLEKRSQQQLAIAQNTTFLTIAGSVLVFGLLLQALALVNRDIIWRKQAADSLRESEERYRAFIEQSSEGIWRFELEEPISIQRPENEQIDHFYRYGYLAECNNVMAQMYSYTSATELVGVRLKDLLIESPENIEYLRSFIRSGYRLNAAESHEVDQHGGAKYFLNSLVGIVENGVLVRAWGTQLDITQRKQLEDALKQKSVEREVLLNSIPALVYYKDLASNYIAVNQTFAEIINTPIDKIPGKNDFDFFPEEQAAAFRKDDREVMELGDRKWNIEERLTSADGKTMWVATYKTPYRNQSAEITGMVGITIDITERKQIEEALRERETRYRLVARATNDAIWDWDLVTNTVEWNEGVETLFGYWATDVSSGSNWWYEHIHPDDRARIVSGIHEVIDSGGQIWTDEYRFLRADKSYALVIDRGFVAHDEQGKPVRMIGSMMDITERKKAEAELCFSEARFRMLLDNVQDYAILLLDINARVVRWGVGAVNILGYQEAEIMGQPGSIIFTPEDLERGADKEELNQAVAEGKAEDERWHVRKDGSRFWASGIMTALRDESGYLQGFAKIMRDFTERKQAEEALRESDARLRLALDAAQLGDWDLDLVTKTARRSRLHDQAFGYNSLLPDWSYEIFLNHVHPEDREFVDQKFQRTLVTGEDWEFECRVIWADQSIHWIWSRASIYSDSDGNQIRMLGAVKEITARKQAEAEREQLLAREQEARIEAEAANRMKDEFLATLSHELRTPLNAMAGWTQLLRTRKFDEKTTARALETIDRNTKSLAQLIEDVLDVSRIITGKLRLNMSHVELVPVIEAAIETVQPAADAKHIQIELILQAAGGSVFGDVNRLQQVFWNLLSNAVKFTPKGGRIEIELEMIDSRMQVRVKDTGLGIAPEFLPYVFERFRQADSTTTRSYGGLGLGLAIVRHLVELHGGTVSVESAGAGLGATFIVNLPLRAVRLATSQPERVKLAGEVPYISNLRSLEGVQVLVVDDEPDARELITTVLEEYKAQVIAVSTAEAALEAIKQLQPNVLVSDIGMPEEDGYALIRKVRALDVHQGGRIPAVALTAYARAEDRTQALLAGFQQHISKPVDPAELAAVVASLTGRNQNT